MRLSQMLWTQLALASAVLISARPTAAEPVAPSMPNSPSLVNSAVAGEVAEPLHFCSIDGLNDPVAKAFKRHFMESDRVAFHSLGSPNYASRGWAKRACSNAVSCDVLIINAELFSGGKKNPKLSLKEVFAGVEREQCQGLAAKPVQVFFVGHQTMDVASQEFLKKGGLFSALTEIYGFGGQRPQFRDVDMAIEDFVSSTDEYLNGVRAKVAARNASCFHYTANELPKPRELGGMNSVLAANWITVDGPNRMTAASSNCPKF